MVLMADADDVEAIALLDRKRLGLEAWSETSWAAEIGSTGRLCQLVQDDAGSTVGFADWLLPGADRTAELLKIAVSGSRSREGIGSMLMDAGLRLMAEAGAEEVLLEVAAANSAALAMYRGYGFTTLARRAKYYRDGSDALVMRLPLGPLGEPR